MDSRCTPKSDVGTICTQYSNSGAFVPQEPFELLDPEGSSQPREQDEMLRAGDRPRGVELDHPQVVHDLLDGGRARRRQPLALDAQPPRRAGVEHQGGRHAMQGSGRYFVIASAKLAKFST